jgi:hypothetical protein
MREMFAAFKYIIGYFVASSSSCVVRHIVVHCHLRHIVVSVAIHCAYVRRIKWNIASRGHLKSVIGVINRSIRNRGTVWLAQSKGIL